ncbi:MAG: ABC transporter permease, partial [Anaerolineae bacterium]|nr:ABC transporter permease [Anaerolineae bacterium]
MWTKLIAIARKDIYVAFRDRNALMIMFAAPIAIAAIIGLAFGSGGDVSIDAVPVAVANQDSGATLPGGQTLVLGQTVQEAFVPTGNAEADADFQQIYELTDGEAITDISSARQQVEDGDLAAVITIPEDFTQRALTGSEPGAIAVYYDSGRSVGPSVVISILRYITNGMNTVLLAQRVGPAYLAQLGGTLGVDQSAIAQAVERFSADAMAAALEPPIQLEQVNLQGKTRTFDAMQYFAPSMAILFMTFTMAAGGTGILIEQRAWTLQRIMTTPTPRWVFMGGKLLGTYLTGVIQMVMLLGLMSLVAMMLGRKTSVWGTNYIGIALLLLMVSFAATSLGLAIAAFAKSEAQASTYNTVALFLLGMLGGSFVQIEGLPDAIGWLPKLTLNYWGIQGFFDLSTGEATVADIGPNLLALAAIGVVLFAVSLWRFNRRLDV